MLLRTVHFEDVSDDTIIKCFKNQDDNIVITVTHFDNEISIELNYETVCSFIDELRIEIQK